MKALPGLVLIAVVQLACVQSAPAAEPGAEESKLENAFRGVMQDRTAHTPEQAPFVEKCGMCHRQMGMGTLLLARRLGPKQAMLESRTDLTPALIRMAVRQGLGNMPRLARGEVSDAELARIIAYLTAPHPPAGPR